MLGCNTFVHGKLQICRCWVPSKCNQTNFKNSQNWALVQARAHISRFWKKWSKQQYTTSENLKFLNNLENWPLASSSFVVFRNTVLSRTDDISIQNWALVQARAQFSRYWKKWNQQINLVGILKIDLSLARELDFPCVSQHFVCQKSMKFGCPGAPGGAPRVHLDGAWLTQGIWGRQGLLSGALGPLLEAQNIKKTLEKQGCSKELKKNKCFVFSTLTSLKQGSHAGKIANL